MKKTLLAMTAVVSMVGCKAQDVTLPAPDMSQTSLSVIEALATRHSTREFSSKQLTEQELSNLCWAACGVSRSHEYRTAPTARNMKEIRLFVFTDKQVYEYRPVENVLSLVAEGDHRELMASNGPSTDGKGFTQDFVKEAPVSLVMVIDFDVFGRNNEQAMRMGCVDAGNVSENINLYCQAVGLATVPRATMDIEAVRQLLKLTENQLPIMNNTVGWPKE